MYTGIGSSFRMYHGRSLRDVVPVGLAPVSVTVKPSSFSGVMSPLTGMKIVFVVSPALKLIVPDGSVPPKSVPSAANPVIELLPFTT